VWTLHAEGRLDLATAEPARGDGRSLAELQAAMGPAEGCAAHYERLAALGIELGGAFQGLVRAQRLEGQSLAEIALPAGREGDAVAWSHPSLVDAALQAIGLAIPSSDDDDTYLLTSITHAVLSAPLPPRFWCHARLRDVGAVQRAEMQADLTLFAPSGAVIGSLAGVGLRRATRAALARAVEGAARRSDLFYEVQWETVAPGEGAAASMAAPASYVPEVRKRFAALAVEHGLDVYARLLPALDRLSAGYVGAAFRELGFVATPGRVFTAEAEAARLGVQPRHARLFARLLGMLEEDGALKRDGGGYRVAGVLDTDDPDARCDALIAQFAPVTAELSTLRRCGRALARVLCGRQDPLQLLFPDGSFAEARALYVDSPYARTYNAALGEALRRAIAGFPPGRRLRVLEVGGGTGGTTSYVLPLLADERVEYTFTDLSPLFVEKAREEFAAYPFVRGAPLDIERDPVAQGFTAGSFDVVIAANVLHATAHLQMAVANVRTLLASSGTLLLLEGVAPERWVDLTFGLTEGWWRFTDTTLRPSYPLITRDAWRRLLADSGFTGAATIPGDGPGARGAAQQALIVAQAPRAAREWTLVTDRGGVAAAVVRRLEARGDAVTVLPAAAPDRASALRGEVVYLGAIDLAGARDSSAPATSEALSLACEIPLEWLAHVRANDSAGRVWLVTRGAEPAAGIEVEEPEWQAPLWGLGRVFALEQPAHWGGLVDLPPAGTADALAELLIEELDAADGQDQVALRGGQRYVARLVHAAAPATSTPRFRSDASYLITGGFGGLGLLVGRWMAQHGARHIALLGRHPDPASEGVRAIEALGARVISLGGDVASEPEMTALFARFGAELPPLRGIMHTAAQLTAAPIGELTRPEVSGMLRPKVAGTMLLERLAHDRNLDFLVLFSSTTALLGASGFAHYAAANAFLDAAARTAHRRGRRVLSVNWGTWEAMRLATEDQQREYRRSGLEPMPAADALDALGRLLAAQVPRGIVARIDWDVLKPLHEARRARPFLAKVGGTVRAPKPKQRAQAGPTLAERLANVPASARHDVLVEFVRSEVAAVLGIDPGTPIPPDTGLFELGMDSLMSVELKRRLAAGAERPLPSTLTFNYPSVGALAGFLEQLLTVASAPSEAAGKAPESEARERVPSSDAAIDSLSDSELEARLRARLEQSL
jgi:SAM-dependent methyltransferase/NADP-dependent 3-hydroxy acid dehydrogenase YdfG/acyl carrier protein